MGSKRQLSGGRYYNFKVISALVCLFLQYNTYSFDYDVRIIEDLRVTEREIYRYEQEMCKEAEHHQMLIAVIFMTKRPLTDR